jgi:capsular polysaccharide export protein
MILLASRGIAQIQHLETLLGEPVKLAGYGCDGVGVRAVAGWGMKESARKAQALAKRLSLPYLALEDGFLRSVEVGQNAPPLSLVLDDLGIYYDASRASRLEGLVAEDIDADALARAASLRHAWCEGGVSKYNYARSYEGELPANFVLVVDQTFGDASITYGLASAASFEQMLSCALSENPTAQIVLKVHPEVMLGRKRGHFDLAALAKEPRITVLGSDAHPASLLAAAAAVYVVTSQMGFEGLLWGKRVRTFGMPFYAGWGLTEDAQAAPLRRRKVVLENLVHGALIAYPRYLDPETGQRCEPERLIAWMAWQRQMRQRFPERLLAIGFPAFKKKTVRQFCQGSQVEFADQPRLKTDKTIVWGMALANGETSSGEVSDSVFLRLEDGFLRSVGLGADWVRPLSWVMDTRGIYYDATRLSDLEHIYQTHDFDAPLLARAANLRQRIIREGVTKYNVGAGVWQRPANAARVILVPGQVESDASITFGAPVGACSVRRNMALLQAVRQANPDAYVVYKPHPDVLAGLRLQGENEDSALNWCDEVVTAVPMAVMLDCVDEVHVITSLAGFEALLRGKTVCCYGQPFYAGWGLTMDRAPLARRTRRLSLDALVAGALILYPTYVSRITRQFTTPERVLDELLQWREAQAKGRVPLWRKLWRLILQRLKW